MFHFIMEGHFMRYTSLGIMGNPLPLDHFCEFVVTSILKGEPWHPFAFQVKDRERSNLNALKNFLVIGYLFGFLKKGTTLIDKCIRIDRVEGIDPILEMFLWGHKSLHKVEILFDEFSGPSIIAINKIVDDLCRIGLRIP